MKLSKQEQKFKDLLAVIPAEVRYDLTPTLQKLDALTVGCQIKMEILSANKENGMPITDKKVTVLTEGKNALDAQYKALRLALIQLRLL